MNQSGWGGGVVRLFVAFAIVLWEGTDGGGTARPSILSHRCHLIPPPSLSLSHTKTERKVRRYHVFQYCQVANKANAALEDYQGLFCAPGAEQ